MRSVGLPASHSWQKKQVRTSTTDLPSITALNVLLVEDGKANQLLAQKMLQKWGHQVVIAENGEQALQRWQDGGFDLILMDVQMPVMDGITATRRIRELEANGNTHIPIVAMTAHAMKGDRDRCIDAGMDAYVAKPFRQHELNSVLVKLFSENGKGVAVKQRQK